MAISRQLLSGDWIAVRSESILLLIVAAIWGASVSRIPHSSQPVLLSWAIRNTRHGVDDSDVSGFLLTIVSIKLIPRLSTWLAGVTRL